MPKICLPTSEEIKAIKDGLKGVIKKWFSDGRIDAATDGNTKPFKDLYWDIVRSDFDYGKLPTLKQIKKLDKAVSKYSTGLTKTSGTLGTWFKLPESILKKNPITRKYFKSIDIASNHYRGNLETYQSEFTSIIRLLNETMKNNTVSNRWGLSVKNAEKKLASLEATYQKKFEEGKYEEAFKRYRKR